MTMALQQALRGVSRGSLWPSTMARLESIVELPSCENVASRLWHRGFADETAQGTSIEAAGGDAVAEVPVAELDRGRRKGRRPTRAEKGSYMGNQDFVRELEANSLKVPEGVPIYDLQTDIPGFYESRMPFTERLNRILETNPEMIEMLLSPVPPPPYPGAKDILRWQTHMVLQVGPDNLQHPMNRKVRCQVYLRDLQEEAGLTDAALQHIALVCGPRYNPEKGEVTLTCEKYPDREENRRDILDTVHALIAEGERKHPQTDPAIIKQQQERKRARENLPPMTVPEYNPLKRKQKQQQQ